MMRNNRPWHLLGGAPKWLPDRTIMFGLGGSHAYGLNTASSDIDYRGVALPRREAVLGVLDNFDQAMWKSPPGVITPYECTVMSLPKFVKLALDCNPNIIEMLWTEYVWYESEWFKFVAIRDAFLSKKAKFTFSGYAIGQLKRIKTHRKWLLDPPKAPPTRADFGLPERPLMPKEQVDAAAAAIQKQLDAWELNLDGVDPATKQQLIDTVAELTPQGEARHQAAAKAVGLGDDVIAVMAKERKYRDAKRHWQNYQTWMRERNPARAALEAEYGYDCYLDDTEFLTENGWKRYDEVTGDERLGTFNVSTSRIEFQRPTERVAKSYTGQIGVLHPRHSNCAVTLNHRMLTSSAHRSAATNFSTAYDDDTADWTIKPLAELLQGRRSYYHVRLTADGKQQDAPYDDALITLTGLYVAEGCVSKRLADGSASVLRLSQKVDGRATPYFKDVAEAWPDDVRQYRYVHDDEWRNEPCEELVLTVANRALATQLDEWCGSGSATKRLPKWAFDLSVDQAELLLDVLVAGDGTERKHSRVYYTTSKRLADDIQTLCVMNGVVSQVWGPYEYPERSNDTPMYQVYIGARQEATAVSLREEGSQSFHIEEVTGARIVCFTVPNEVLVTRRHGKIAIQGNTKHAMHLVRLMRMGHEILTGQGVIVKRPDAEELLAIRHGAWEYDKLVEWAEARDAELQELYATSTLPHKPDAKRVNDVLMDVLEAAVRKP